jgi:hypothetical protein
MDAQWSAIRAELPSATVTPSKQLWSTIGHMPLPVIVGGGDPRPRDANWVLVMLERVAEWFLAFEQANSWRRTYRHVDIDRAAGPLIALIREMPGTTAQAKADAVAAVVAEAKARAADKPAPQGAARLWYFGMLLYAWEQAGGVTRSSPTGPLVRFLEAAVNPVLVKAGYKRLKRETLHKEVRKLLARRERAGALHRPVPQPER